MINFEIDDPSRLIGADFAGTLIQGIYKGAETLRDKALGKIIDKTQYAKGGLQADETGTFNSDPSNTELVHIYTETANQLANWNRVYVAYQEGGELGLATYTNEAHMMFQSTADDTPFFTTWGVDMLQNGINIIISGGSLRL